MLNIFVKSKSCLKPMLSCNMLLWEYRENANNAKGLKVKVSLTGISTFKPTFS